MSCVPKKVSALALPTLSAGILLGILAITIGSSGGYRPGRQQNRAQAAAPLPAAQPTGNAVFLPLHFGVFVEEVEAHIEWPVLTLSTSAERFVQPVQATHAGDGSGRLFVVERGGAVHIVENDVRRATPFLDISERVTTANECGLLSIAFPPTFDRAGYFFVYYNHNEEQIGPSEISCDTVVARFRLTDDPNVADPASEEQILLIDQPFDNHNGGQILFGPDGFLYIGMGDGGDAGDPDDNGQNPGTLLGKMLRVEVGASGTYTIPASNPYTQTTAYRGEIWASGLRNPWRFSFDRETGELYTADVGQGREEEINVQPASSRGGENYGWDIVEGKECFEPRQGCDRSGLTPPVWTYGRENGDRSVTGGFVYRGGDDSRMWGIYFYGDYASGRLWGLQQHKGEWRNQLLLDTDLNITGFGEDEVGHLYLLDYRGGLHRLRDGGDPGTQNPASEPSATPPADGVAWDARLDQRGARFLPVTPTPGEGYWKLVEGNWLDEDQSGGRHHIFVDVLDEEGERQVDVPLLVRWPGGTATIQTEAKPGEPHAANFAMFSIAPAYAISPDDGHLADAVDGLGMGTIEEPFNAVHTSYEFVWQWTAADEHVLITATPTLTPTLTATPAITATPIVTATPVPTSTVVITATQVMKPTATPTTGARPVSSQSARRLRNTS